MSRRGHKPPVMHPDLLFSFGPDSWRLATIDEHAAAAGTDVETFLNMIEGHLSGGWLSLESSDSQLFLRTTPSNGEPPVVAANQWEELRRASDKPTAAARWRRIRDLERGGWHVETRQRILGPRFAALRPSPWAGVEVQGRGVPLAVDVPYARLSSVLDSWSAAGEPLVAVTCAPGGLSELVAATRSWVLTRGAVAGGRWMSVLALEAPSYTATLLRCDDNSVTPIAFAQREQPG